MDKAPGPDGFTGRFYKSCWNIIRNDVLSALAAIYGGHHADVSLVKDYRPISLIHSFAKLVTKVLANRLAPLLPKLVSNNQSAFVRGRNIHDNFLLVQQLARKLHRSKEPHILLKLDISKAFDMVSWPFLIEVLQHLGFGRRWCNLLCLLLSTSTTQVLVNGTPGRLICHRQGLRQGDPLSPMLFILVMDVLNSLIQVAASESQLRPIAGQQNWLRISLYADDVVIFLRPEHGDLSVVRDLLHCFGIVSGLKTNLLKSSAIPIQCTEEDIDVLLASFHAHFPCSYLVIPLTILKPTKSDLQPLVDKVANMLPGWKAPLLTKAGRLVIIKSVFSATPIHLMIALDLPKWVIKAIDKRRQGFLWKGQEQANGGNCLVSWAKVQRPFLYGGLGVHDLERMGWALRLRLVSQSKSPNKRRLSIKWQLKSQLKDKWIQGKSVADLAPNLFRVIPKRIIKRRTVSQALSNRTWVSDIKGGLTVQVLSEYLHIWELVEDIALQPDAPDKHTCFLRLLQQQVCLYNAMFIGTIRFPPWKRIWKSWAPANCKLFIWLAINNRCWTSDRLAKRGLPHQSACPFCDQAPETINHVLSSCVLAREVWTVVLQKLNQVMRPPDSGSRLNSWWCRTVSSLPKELRKGFNSLVLLVSWELWKHRNACVFEKVRLDAQAVMHSLAAEGHLWCLAGSSALHDLVVRAAS
ncbi:LOW QUALITY PROTEIN: hypothetical protein U9M48_003556 [Paspalum notatum var. saurae]|uniref:Reverse transcriptase domain-containing protein n=1 Tax=Paspalum notatum var. saurae TaxID=547442 RepID=A0AAQ3SKP8_PASNO